MPQLGNHLLKGLVWLGAQHEVAAAEDVGGYGVDPNRFRIVSIVIDDRRVAILSDGFPELRCVKPDLLSNAHKVVRIFQLTGASPVRFEESLVHLLELSLLAGELGGAKGSTRVDDDVALVHRQTNLSSDRVEVASHLL